MAKSLVSLKEVFVVKSCQCHSVGGGDTNCGSTANNHVFYCLAHFLRRVKSEPLDTSWKDPLVQHFEAVFDPLQRLQHLKKVPGFNESTSDRQG